MIRVVVAEDQALLFGAIAALLDLEPDLMVAGRACDGIEALAIVPELSPDILLTDIQMPSRSGRDVAQEVGESGLVTRVVIVTTFGRAG